MCLVDIGGGTSDIAIFHRWLHSAHRGYSHCWGPGDQRYRDGAANANPACGRDQDSLRLRADAARRCRRDHQRCPASVIARHEICRASLSPRWSSLAMTSCSRSFRPKFAALATRKLFLRAVVLLTGGTSKMEGAVELAEEIFHMPVRLVPPDMPGASTTLFAIPFMPPRWVC